VKQTPPDAAPRVTVVVPVRDAAGCVEDCLRSLAAQSYPHAEVLVVDNGSRDDTRERVARHPVTLLVESQHGSYAARNAGVRAARGDLIAFIDADCVAEPDWLAAGIAGFADPAVGCVCGPIRGAGPGRSAVERYLVRRGMLSQRATLEHAFKPYAQTANALYRRGVFDTVGLFEERWPSGGDADLCWRMQLHGGFCLRFEPGAGVEHRHRSTLGAMVRQRYRHGTGRALLQAKYAERWAASSLRDGAREIAGAVVRLATLGGGPRGGAHRGERIRDAALDLLFSGAYHAGALRALRAPGALQVEAP
jgi:GT2 family glycosyltransferase